MQLRSVFLALGVITTLTFVGGHTANAKSNETAKKSETSTQKEVKNEDAKKEIKKVTYKIKSGDTLTKIAKNYDKDHKTTYVRIFNANKRIKHPDVINVGDKIRIPAKDEKLPKRFAKFKDAASAPAPAQAQTADWQAAAPADTSYQAASAPQGSTAGNTYYWGNCTWYVKNRRGDLPNMLGNGGQWSANAAAQGYATGTKPQPGAVAEQGGHVAYVESVKGNMVTVSEMNFGGGLGSTSTRTVPADTFFSYIY